MSDVRENILSRYQDALEEGTEDSPFVVFLCGPSLAKKWFPKKSAKLRSELRQVLEGEGFEVFLGEDDGLEELQKYFDLGAQENELLFIKHECNAVIIVADSVGAFCELGLFSWHFAHPDGVISRDKTHLLVLIDGKTKKHQSYLNLGPVHSIDATDGRVEYVNFRTYDHEPLIKRLRSLRALYSKETRGRRRKRRR